MKTTLSIFLFALLAGCVSHPKPETRNPEQVFAVQSRAQPAEVVPPAPVITNTFYWHVYLTPTNRSDPSEWTSYWKLAGALQSPDLVHWEPCAAIFDWHNNQPVIKTETTNSSLLFRFLFATNSPDVLINRDWREARYAVYNFPEQGVL